MRIITLGNGFIAQHLPYLIIKDRINFFNIDSIIDNYKPDVIINSIGKTGTPNIDWCEHNKDVTAMTNVSIPILLSEHCKKRCIKMIHISSGCIFFGESSNIKDGIDLGWKETDFANPLSYYSRTKYACDLVLDSNDVAILRIRMPISSNKNHPRNLINKLSKYDKIIDIPNSMTFVSDFVKCINWVIDKDIKGIFHVVNPQPLTACKIMNEYCKYCEKKFERITEDELDRLTLAKRSNCILNTDKLNKSGFHMTNSDEALSKCMKEYFS